MKLYVNGDSHTAGAEAVNSCAFAEDDGNLSYLGRLPHPENLAVSWGRVLADILKMGFKCDAESAASNTRIIRTTRQWIEQNPQAVSETLFIIQWSTWERQEWLIDGEYYQINASGIDVVPESHQQQYKKFVSNVNWAEVTSQAHEQIWQFHQELTESNIQHIFFNGNNHFASIPVSKRYEWGSSYVSPYNDQMTYNQWLLNNGHDTVAPNSYHFGKTAHAAWAGFMLQYIIANKLI